MFLLCLRTKRENSRSCFFVEKYNSLSDNGMNARIVGFVGNNNNNKDYPRKYM
jgi:hypothetical protein